MARRSPLLSLPALLATLALAPGAGAQESPPAAPPPSEAPVHEGPEASTDEPDDGADDADNEAPGEPAPAGEELPGLEGTGAEPPAGPSAADSAPPPATEPAPSEGMPTDAPTAAGAAPPPPVAEPAPPPAAAPPSAAESPSSAAPPPAEGAPPPAAASSGERTDLVAPVEGKLPGGKTKVEGQPDQVNVEQTGPAGWLSSFLGSGEHPKFTVGLAGGYTLRMHEDDRTHGAGLTGFVDVPLAYGFGAQFTAYGQGWIPSEKAPDPLGLIGGAGSLIYAFDDTDAVAWVGIGPTGAIGIVSDGGDMEFVPHAGAMLSFGVRFPLGESTRAEVAVRAPIYVWDPNNGLNLNLPIGTNQVTNPSPSLFPTQVLMTAGLNFEPFGFMDAMADHGNITKALLPSWLLFGTDKKKDLTTTGPSPKPKQAPADGDNKPAAPADDK